MDLINILELSSYGVGCIGAILITGVGVLQGNYNFENATKFYNDAPVDIKELIGEPKESKIYFQSIMNAPKFMYYTLKNKRVNDAFTNYVKPIEKERGKEFMKLYCLGQLMKDKKSEL